MESLGLFLERMLKQEFWQLLTRTNWLGTGQNGEADSTFIQTGEILTQECINTGHHIARVTTFSKVATNISESPVWNLRGVTLLPPRILKWRLNCSKICELLF